MNLFHQSKNYWKTRLPQYWYSAEERYSIHFPYLYNIAEFRYHAEDLVLEIGIGVGTDLLQYAKHGSYCFGIDFTEKAIDITTQLFHRNNLNAELEVCNAEKLPYRDNYFNIVFSFGVIHHIIDMDKALKEIYRVLRPNGKAIIWVYAKGWWYYLFVPIYHGILLGDLLSMSFKEMILKHTEMQGHCPIARYFNRRELIKLFSNYSHLEIINHRGITTLGNRFYRLNKLFCSIMNFFFPYGAYTVKAVK